MQENRWSKVQFDKELEKKNGVHECPTIVSVSSRSSIKRFTLDRRPVIIIIEDA